MLNLETLVVMYWPINLAAVALLVAAAVWDVRTGTVPPALTLPPLTALLIWRALRGDWVVLLFWAGAFMLWRLHIARGGDVKLLMIEMGLWPSATFVVVASVTVAVLSFVVLVVRYRGVRPLLNHLRSVFLTLPSRQELELYGTPGAFLIVAAAVVYLAWLYGIGLAYGH